MQTVCAFFSVPAFYIMMVAGILIVIIIIIARDIGLILDVNIVGSQQNSLHAVISAGCLCSGDTVTFECIAVGPGITLWQGSAFMNCESNNIVLLHSQFLSSMGTSGTCNDGAIIGWSLTVDNNCFISRLNVTMSTELQDRYIECVYDDGIHPLSVGLSKMLRLTGATVCQVNTILLSPKFLQAVKSKFTVYFHFRVLW